MIPPFLLRNLSKEKKEETKTEINLINENINLKTENINLKKELTFYKSLFKTHYNSVVFNLYSKMINGVNVWVDPIRDSHETLNRLDKDEQVGKWLEPVKCER
jgi:hypothetical protein